jgi:hypothetical protein
MDELHLSGKHWKYTDESVDTSASWEHKTWAGKPTQQQVTSE